MASGKGKGDGKTGNGKADKGKKKTQKTVGIVASVCCCCCVLTMPLWGPILGIGAAGKFASQNPELAGQLVQKGAMMLFGSSKKTNKHLLWVLLIALGIFMWVLYKNHASSKMNDAPKENSSNDKENSSNDNNKGITTNNDRVTANRCKAPACKSCLQ